MKEVLTFVLGFNVGVSITFTFSFTFYIIVFSTSYISKAPRSNIVQVSRDARREVAFESRLRRLHEAQPVHVHDLALSVARRPAYVQPADATTAGCAGSLSRPASPTS